MNLTTQIGNSVEEASFLLKNGGLVAIPTETVYGLAANAMDPDAVVRIYQVKGRPLSNPLIVHVAELASIRSLVREWPRMLDRLSETFWPGPLTVLLPKSDWVPPIVTAGSDRVAIRIPDHPLTLDLIRQCGFPLAAPSANLYTRISPTSAEHVRRQLDGQIPYILDGGPCTVGLESTIIGLEGDRWVLYRKGAITIHDLEPLLGFVLSNTEGEGDHTPGASPLHYAPKVPLHFGPIDLTDPRLQSLSTAVLTFKQRILTNGTAIQYVLSPEGNLAIAARELYNALHYFDTLPLKCILAEPCPDEGLGTAINDRLIRAAGKG